MIKQFFLPTKDIQDISYNIIDFMLDNSNCYNIAKQASGLLIHDKFRQAYELLCWPRQIVGIESVTCPCWGVLLPRKTPSIKPRMWADPAPPSFQPRQLGGLSRWKPSYLCVLTNCYCLPVPIRINLVSCCRVALQLNRDHYDDFMCWVERASRWGRPRPSQSGSRCYVRYICK